MDSDEVSQIHESMVDDWLHRLGNYNTQGIEKLASKYRSGDKCICVKMNNGSFKWYYKDMKLQAPSISRGTKAKQKSKFLAAFKFHMNNPILTMQA